MDSKQSSTTDLLNILGKAMDANMYGSVEVYLEDGQITQITQRIIKKIKKAKALEPVKKVNSVKPRKDKKVSEKIQS